MRLLEVDITQLMPQNVRHSVSTTRIKNKYMTHQKGPTARTASSTVPTQVVDEFSLVPRDDPARPAYYASGDLYTTLATSRETDFDFNFFDFFLPVNGGPPIHYHSLAHEVWYTTEGKIKFNLGNQGNDNLVVPEGTLVFGPREKIHGYRNLDSTVSVSGATQGARTLSMTTPGALDLMFSATSTRATDRDDPIPTFSNAADEEAFKDLAKFVARTNAGITLKSLDPNYEAPKDALDYVITLPEDAKGKAVERAKELAKLDGFSVWTTGNQSGLPKRPTFTGPFGIEYTSLVNLEESGNEFSYNQFSLEPQEPKTFDTFTQANLTGSQVVEPTKSQATGVANLELNSEDEIDYSLTVNGLDFGELEEGSTPQTPNNENDDVTGIHIHSGEQGTNGSHAFNVVDSNKQDENDLNITLNEDGSTTLSGTWNQEEKEIPKSLVDFFNSDVPGTQSDFYFQIHTEGNSNGEIRGQIARTTDAENFPDPVKSEDHELFYVNEGQLSLKIGDEVRIAQEDTFAYIPPGQEYSIANFGDKTVDSLAVTAVNDQESPSTAGNDLFPSPLNPQDGTLPNELVSLGNEADFFDDQSAQESESRRRIYGGKADDELFATREDDLFGEEGDDILDASRGKGGNRLYGGKGNDEILVNVEDRGFGGDEDDLLDASFGKGQQRLDDTGHNLLDGSGGDDLLIAGSKDQLVGGDGKDLLNIRQGGHNLLYGGSGADQFRIANGRLPNAVDVQYPEDPNSLLPKGLSVPDLVDTKNTIKDFELGVDKIHIRGIDDVVSSFDDLELLPAFRDLRSTSIIAQFTEDGIEKEISLANVSGVIFNELSANDFVFT
jgi:quercetin dioxygenase-like cupin family protein